MPVDLNTIVGNASPQSSGTPNQNLYADMFGNVKVTEMGLRFYELNRRNLLFTTGMQDTALIAANAIATGLSATAKPIIGIYNPVGSGVDLVLLKTYLAISTIANTAVNPQGFHYVVGSTGVNLITTGTPGGAMSCNTLLKQGSQATIITGGNTALTGLVGNAVVLKPVEVAPVLNAAGNATAVSFANGVVSEAVEGSITVKQGQFLGIMNQASTTTVDVLASLLWAELPTLS